MSLLASRCPAGLAACLAVAAVFSGCGAVRRTVIGGAAEAFSGPEVAEVFSSDNDPELVGDAMPLALKTYEILIVKEKHNKELYLAAASGFITYAAAFVEAEAEELAEVDFAGAQERRARAVLLSLRGRDYAFRGLEIEHPGFAARLREDPSAALGWMTANDVPLLYWAGAGWGKAISGDRSDPARMAEVPVVEAVMRKVLELDEGYGDGDVHEFFIVFEGGRSEAMGGSPERAREHYRRAVELSGGDKASPHVALASTVAVREQDLGAFRNLLGKALAVDVNRKKRWRLGNVLAQRKARRLLERIPDLFVDYEEEGEDR